MKIKLYLKPYIFRTCFAVKVELKVIKKIFIYNY